MPAHRFAPPPTAKDGLDRCRGKRVALIGCAAAAIQLVPAIAAVEPAFLGVHGRTPNHVVERPNDPFPEDLKKKWRENPMELRLYRAKFEQEFALTWFETGFVRGAPRYNAYLESAKRNLQQVQDPALREKLWPEFDLWCRRILFHNDSYKALNLPYVHYLTEKIRRIEKDGVVTTTQNSRDESDDPNAEEIKREYDVIIWATVGFLGRLSTTLDSR